MKKIRRKTIYWTIFVHHNPGLLLNSWQITAADPHLKACLPRDRQWTIMEKGVLFILCIHINRCLYLWSLYTELFPDLNIFNHCLLIADKNIYIIMYLDVWWSDATKIILSIKAASAVVWPAGAKRTLAIPFCPALTGWAGATRSPSAWPLWSEQQMTNLFYIFSVGLSP